MQNFLWNLLGFTTMSEELLVSIQKAKSDLAKALMSGVKERVEQVRRSFEVYFIYIYISTQNIHLRGILRCAGNFLATWFFFFNFSCMNILGCFASPAPSLPHNVSYDLSLIIWKISYMKIMYENCGVKNYMKEDHRSYRGNFCNWEKKAWKIQACRGFEPLTSALPVQRSYH